MNTNKLINPWRTCAARVCFLVDSVFLFVCLSVKSHLTCGASVCSENAVPYSAGSEGEKFVGSSSLAPMQALLCV